MKNNYTCNMCEAEFEITTEDNIPPEFCPFCGEKLVHDDKDLDEWFNDDETGC